MADKLNGLKGLTMGSKRTQPPYLQAHLKTAQATARPTFLKELAKPTQESISNFFSNALKKLKHPDTQANDKKENEIHGRQRLQLLDRQNACT